MSTKNTQRNVLIGAIVLFFLWPKKGTAGTGYTPITWTGNGYTPTFGTEGDMNESYLGITPNSINRGIRNNNPGNVKYYSTNNWQGKVLVSQNTDAIDPLDGEPTFEQFVSYPKGIRVIIYILKKYIRNGRNTINIIMDSYSGGEETYKNYLSSFTGKDKDKILEETDEQTIKKLVQGIARFENGQTQVSSPEVITEAQYSTARSIL